MGKILLFALALSANTLAWAQDTDKPTITLTAEVDGNTRDLIFGMATTASKLSIDWGDGNIVETEEIPVDDGWTTKTVTGTPAGEGNIKIYGGEDLASFEASSTVAGAKITAIDVSGATALTELTINTNSISEIDLSKNTKLAKLYANNNQIAEIDLSANTELTYVNLQENKLASIDLSKNTKISTLYLSKNQLTTVDLSANTAIKSLYLLNNSLESVSLGENTTLSYISVNYNKLTTLDLSKQTGLATKASVFATYNNLTELVLPDVTVRTVNITGNKFNLETMPKCFSNVTNLTYAPQQDYEIAAEIYKTLDLSSQAKVGDAATTFTVCKADGTVLTDSVDYTVADGVVSFLTEQADSVYVTMANEAYPKFTGANIFKTTKAAVTGVVTGISSVYEENLDATAEYYTIDGKRVGTNVGKGVYIVRRGSATRKVVVK